MNAEQSAGKCDTQAVNKDFPHPPLDPTARQIRLIRLLSSVDGVVHCELSSFALPETQEQGVEWKALSYCWGTDDASESIRINGNLFLVRPNLHAFLLQMDEGNERSWIFVDAICINQNNVDERSEQVALMGCIYRQAIETLVWIMPEDDSSKWLVSNEWEVLHQKQIHLHLANLGRVRMPVHLRPSDRRAARAARSMIHLVVMSFYWTRLWIVQELLLSNVITFCVGIFRIPSSAVLSYVDSKLDYPGDLENPFGQLPSNDHWGARSSDYEKMLRAKSCAGVMQVRARTNTDNWTRTQRPYHLVLGVFASQNCADVRDKLFGYCGIAHILPLPDYHLTPMDTFVTALVIYMVSAGANPSFDKNMTLLVVCASFGLDPLHPVVYIVSAVVYSALTISTQDFMLALTGAAVRNTLIPGTESRISSVPRDTESDSATIVEFVIAAAEGAVALADDELVEAPVLNGEVETRTKSDWKNMARSISEQVIGLYHSTETQEARTVNSFSAWPNGITGTQNETKPSAFARRISTRLSRAKFW